MSPPLQLTTDVGPTCYADLESVPPTVTKLLNSNISGSPNPTKSPRYPSFDVESHAQSLLNAAERDLVLLVSRFNRRHLSPSCPVSSVPVWSAYNSLMSNGPCKDVAVVKEDPETWWKHRQSNATCNQCTPNEWATLVTLLENMHRTTQLSVRKKLTMSWWHLIWTSTKGHWS